MHPKKMAPFPGPFLASIVVVVMAMTAMLDDYEPFRVGAVPAALTIAHFADPDVNAAAHFAALTAHALTALAAHFAAHAFAALTANFHAALGAIALFAHLAAAFRPACVALDLAAGCRPAGCGALIDGDAGAAFRRVLREGRRRNGYRRSGGEQITELGHVDFL
jgi:hypothetical protein